VKTSSFVIEACLCLSLCFEINEIVQQNTHYSHSTQKHEKLQGKGAKVPSAKHFGSRFVFIALILAEKMTLASQVKLHIIKSFYIRNNIYDIHTKLENCVIFTQQELVQ